MRAVDKSKLPPIATLQALEDQLEEFAHVAHCFLLLCLCATAAQQLCDGLRGEPWRDGEERHEKGGKARAAKFFAQTLQSFADAKHAK
jgi:hypothetical protein